MRRNFKLTIAYDGTAFSGWQRQKADRTVQQEIETAIGTMTGEPIRLVGSGRTDAGVHAVGQTAHFNSRTRLGTDTLRNGLNSLLPDDIAVSGCERVSEDFHARYDVKCKVYRYHIRNCLHRWPIGRHYAWHIRRPLDLRRIRSVLPSLCGRQDYKSFEASGSPRSHTIRHVTRLALGRTGPDAVTIEIEADGFLRYMVRNIVGTLVDCGLGKLKKSDVQGLIAAKDRRLASPTAPPHGLFLVRVCY
jgi:tRNA pseudouridine38-40 synthase